MAKPKGASRDTTHCTEGLNRMRHVQLKRSLCIDPTNQAGRFFYLTQAHETQVPFSFHDYHLDFPQGKAL